MGYVFISHSKIDKPFARDVIGQLHRHGVEAWIDDQKIRAGKRWWETIVTAIRDCSAFVLIMTDESASSDWVNNEILVAKEFEKPIFPLWRNGDPRHPTFLMLANIQYYDVREQEHLSADFIETLKASMSIDPAQITAKGMPAVAQSMDWQPNTERMINLYQSRRQTVTRVGIGVGAVVLIGAVLLIGLPAITGSGTQTPTPAITETAVITPSAPPDVLSRADQPFSPRLLNEWREEEGLDALNLNAALNNSASDYFVNVLETMSYEELTALTIADAAVEISTIAAENGYAGTTQTLMFYTESEAPVTLGGILSRFQLMGDPFMSDYADYGYLQQDSSVSGINSIVIFILGQPN